MIKINKLFKKIALSALILALGFTAIAVTQASASSLPDENTPPVGQTITNERLEKIWAREQEAYANQDERFDNSNDFIAKVQALIDKANEKGLDISAVQSALNAFKIVIPAAQAAHKPGAAIIINHAGFTPNGEVTDRAIAIETVKALRQVIKNSHSAMNGTGRALHEAIKAFRNTHSLPGNPKP